MPNSLVIPDDFVTDFPISNGYDSILVCIDRMTKMSHFIPWFKSTCAPEFDNVISTIKSEMHAQPLDFINSLQSNRGNKNFLAKKTESPIWMQNSINVPCPLVYTSMASTNFPLQPLFAVNHFDPSVAERAT